MPAIAHRAAEQLESVSIHPYPMPPAALLKPALIPLLLFQIAASTPAVEHYRRTVIVAPGSSAQGPRQSCAVLDAAVFAHAAASLKDLRLNAGSNQAHLPYAITRSGPADPEETPAPLLKRVVSGPGQLSFDLRMPPRPYTALDLHFDRADLITNVTISGEQTPGSPKPLRTPLASAILFDLTAQHLFHNTTVPLEESSFPYLHLDLQFAPATGAPPIPDTLTIAASVPPDREAQSLYTSVATTDTFTQRDGHSVATFQLPLHVPIERIDFTLATAFKASFSRRITIAVRADPLPSQPAPAALELITGTILRVHTLENGRALTAESLTIPVAIGSNMQRPATLTVAIENPAGAALPIASVALQMRQRRLCFAPPADALLPLTLSYGDPDLQPQDDAYAANFTPAANPRIAILGPEHSTRTAQPAAAETAADSPAEIRSDRRWLAALAVLAIFALFSLRAVRRRSR